MQVPHGPADRHVTPPSALVNSLTGTGSTRNPFASSRLIVLLYPVGRDHPLTQRQHVAGVGLLARHNQHFHARKLGGPGQRIDGQQRLPPKIGDAAQQVQQAAHRDDVHRHRRERHRAVARPRPRSSGSTARRRRGRAARAHPRPRASPAASARRSRNASLAAAQRAFPRRGGWPRPASAMIALPPMTRAGSCMKQLSG